jgi:hypothetical protein
MRTKISLRHALKLLSLSAFAVYLSGAGSEVLRVEGATGRDGVAKPALSLSLEDLAGMPHVTARVHARDGAERTYEGVLLSEVLKRTGQPSGEDLRGSLLSKYVLAIAHDGYRVLFSLPEIDPAFSDGRIIVAYKVDGKPLPDREGPLRFVIPAEKREARWIRMIEKIEISATPQPMR